jgi:transcriptional regulator with XRE-family HTH domain
MTLARRVRDCRYAKGWGPDELAARAAISRTALYQIECGKTETPRAATLRRIAEALDVPIDALLIADDEQALAPGRSGDPSFNDVGEWPKQPPARLRRRAMSELETLDLLQGEPVAPFRSRTELGRQLSLEQKFLEVLASPLGDLVARIIEETHRLVDPRPTGRLFEDEVADVENCGELRNLG